MNTTTSQKDNKYQLKTQLSQSGLQIKMIDKQNVLGQCYVTKIENLSLYQKLQENFESLAELNTYLTQGNYWFCSETCEFKVIVKVNSNKSKIIEIARLQMVYSQPDLNLALDKLCQRCSISTQNNANSLVLSLAKIVKLSIQKQQKSKRDTSLVKNQEYYDTRREQIRQMFQLKIEQLQQQIQRVHSEIYDQIQKLSHQLSQIQPHHPTSTTTPPQLLNKTLHSKPTKPYISYNNDKQSKLDEWINSQYSSPNLKKYEGNKIASSNSFSTRMFSNIVISNLYKFGILIQELSDVVDVGVISLANRAKNSLYTEKNSDLFVCKSDGMYYDGRNLVTPPQSDRKNRLFSQGDIVDVVVNLEAGSIEWSVNSQVKLSLTNHKLKNPEIKWVVYVRLGKKCCVKLFL